MAYRVSVSARAKRDLDRILVRLLKQGAGESGLRWFRGMQDAIASLDRLPTRCAFAPESVGWRSELRHLLYGSKPHAYRVLFTIEDSVVYVLHVRHGRRMPAKKT